MREPRNIRKVYWINKSEAKKLKEQANKEKLYEGELVRLRLFT